MRRSAEHVGLSPQPLSEWMEETMNVASKGIDLGSLVAIDDRLDRIVNIDVGGRGVEHLYSAARDVQGSALAGSAAQYLAEIDDGSTIVITTGSVSRAWISPEIAENDGPAGVAVVARALAMSKRITVVLLAEATLIPQFSGVLMAAGLTILPLDLARKANQEGTLLAVAVRPFTTEDATAGPEAAKVLDELKPELLMSIERVGRNSDGRYLSMRGVDYGQGRARIDHVFDLAQERGIPTVSVGDGGNEIGMGNVAEAVRTKIRFGDVAADGGAGIGAVTTVDSLVTAACSNWGAYAVVAALAARLDDGRLIHTTSLEKRLLERGSQMGLINSPVGLIEDRVDDIDVATHLAVVELLSAVVARHLSH